MEATVSTAPGLAAIPSALVTTTEYAAASAGETQWSVRWGVCDPLTCRPSLRAVPFRCQE